MLLQAIQQRGLAGARLAAQDQHPALTGPRLSQQLVQRRQLGPPAAQSEPGMTVGHRPPPRRTHEMPRIKPDLTARRPCQASESIPEQSVIKTTPS
jgi:hypothetical protein